MFQAKGHFLRIMRREPAHDDAQRPDHIQARMRPPDPFGALPLEKKDYYR